MVASRINKKFLIDRRLQAKAVIRLNEKYRMKTQFDRKGAPDGEKSEGARGTPTTQRRSSPHTLRPCTRASEERVRPFLPYLKAAGRTANVPSLSVNRNSDTRGRLVSLTSSLSVEMP